MPALVLYALACMIAATAAFSSLTGLPDHDLSACTPSSAGVEDPGPQPRGAAFSIRELPLPWRRRTGMRRINPPLVMVALALSPALAPAAVIAHSTAVLRGRVLAGPTCPVERPGDPACAPRPVVAVVTVSTTRGRVVRTIRSRPDGRFTLTLSPGAYLLKPRALVGVLPVGRAVLVRVRAGRSARVVLLMDTGIR